MTPRVFGIDYQFLSCGSVFTDGLVHAAEDLGIAYQHALWNQVTVDQIAAFVPDLLFVVHGRRFTSRFGTLKTGIPTAVWLLDEPYEVDDTSRWSQNFDAVFLNDAATLDRHARSSVLPVCYDPHVHTSSDGQRPYLVGFIGGGNSARDRVLGALARQNLLSYVVGSAWSDPLVNARFLSDNIPPHRTAAFYQRTQIIVNIFREQHHFNRQGIVATSLNPRVYEALACGALVVSEWRPEIDTLVPELPTFRTEEECVAVVQDLLANPARAEIIRQQCAARLQPHTYASRLQTVLQTIGLAVAA